jgi:hypothetical protein
MMTGSDVDRFAGELLGLARTVHHKTSVEALAGELFDGHDWSNVLTTGEIVGRLKDLYRELYGDTGLTFGDARRRFSEIVTEVEEWSDEQVVWLPVVGLALPNGEVRLGATRVRPLDDAAVSDWN